MEEVVSSNLTRSTKTFQTLTVPSPVKNVVAGVQLESKTQFHARAAMGIVWISIPAHDQAYRST